MKTSIAIAFSSLVVSANVVLAQSGSLGIFSANRDIGSPSHAGSVALNPAIGTYLITGGGSNLWGRTDNFQFVYREMSGDLSFSADVRWPKPGGNPHRKVAQRNGRFLLRLRSARRHREHNRNEAGSRTIS